MRIILAVLLLIVSLALPLTANAQKKNEPTPPQVLNNFVRQGGQLFFLGEYEGMNGWVLIRDGQPEYFYENPDRTVLVMGLMFDKDGQMITMPQLSRLHDRVGDDMYATTGKFGLSDNNQGARAAMAESATAPAPQQNRQEPSPAALANAMTDMVEQSGQSEQQAETRDKPDASDFASMPFGASLTLAEEMFVDLIRSNWITLNPQGTHDIFALIDPNCEHCKQFIVDSEDFLEKEDLRLRVIPVGMNADSARRSAVLLASANPAERLMRFSKGEAEALPAPNNINTEAVRDNTALMVKHNFGVTPVIAYRTKGEKIRLIRGRPADYDNFIRDINKN